MLRLTCCGISKILVCWLVQIAQIHRLIPELNFWALGKTLFIEILQEGLQSNLAIISAFAIGVKLSISRPRPARPARMCWGTSRLFSWGAIDSSTNVRDLWGEIGHEDLPWREKSNRVGISLTWPPGCRESGNRVLGSRSSSKKGCTIASIAESLSVGVYSETWNELNGIIVGFAENLVEGMRFDLGKFMLHIVRVHRTNLVTSWCPQNFDDLHQLIDTRLSWEQRLPQHQLRHDTAGRPNV